MSVERGAYRRQVFELIQAEWTLLDFVVGRLTPSDRRIQVLDAEATDPWTIEFVVVHIAGWKRNATRVAERFVAPDACLDDRFPAEILALDLNQFNHQVFLDWQAGKTRAIEEHRQAHCDLVTTLERVPENCLVAGDRPVLWLTPALGHSGFHRSNHIERLLRH